MKPFLILLTLCSFLAISVKAQMTSPSFGQETITLPTNTNETRPIAQPKENIENEEEPVVAPTVEVAFKKTIESLDIAEGKKAKIEKRFHKKMKKEKFKNKLKDAFEAVSIKNATFEDFITLAGAIVTLVGILSIIADPVTGIVVAVLGLLVYLLGRNAGGSLNNIF